MIKLIARYLRDKNASSLKGVSTRFRDLVHAQSHPTILNANNVYKSNASESLSPPGCFQLLYGKRIYRKNQNNLKDRKRAARLLPPNRVPVKGSSYSYRDGQPVYSLRRQSGYFSSKSGQPYSTLEIRPIPQKRIYPFGRNSPPRVGRPRKHLANL